MSKLLASAPTIDGITAMVNRFWCSTEYRVNPDTLAIEHPTREAPKSARVVKRGNRYRFEAIGLN